MQKAYIFIGDLHIGGLTDFKAIEILVLKLQLLLRILKPSERILVILGDIVEDSRQESQCLIAHPIQKAKYASYVIKWITEELAVDGVVLMPGDNGLYEYDGRTITSMIKEDLEKLGVDTKIVKEGHIVKIGEKSVVLCHTLKRVSRKHGAGLIGAEAYNADIMICSQHHVYVMTHKLILLPSFQWSNNLAHKTKGGILMTDSGLIIPIILKQMTDYNNPELIDELDSWLHSIKQKVLDNMETEEIRLCIDYEGYRRSRRLERGLYEKIKLMLKAGVPVKAIARKVGVTPTTVRFVKYGYKC